MSQENLQHQVEALANLATAVMSNHQAFDVLTNTNLQLNQTNMELLKKTEALEAKINSMQKPNGRATKPPPPPKSLDLNGCCSAQGFKVTHSHNSKMCKTPGLDHNINATCENTIRGLQHGKDE
jgi:hypothetical protein